MVPAQNLRALARGAAGVTSCAWRRIGVRRWTSRSSAAAGAAATWRTTCCRLANNWKVDSWAVQQRLCTDRHDEGIDDRELSHCRGASHGPRPHGSRLGFGLVRLPNGKSTPCGGSGYRRRCGSAGAARRLPRPIAQDSRAELRKVPRHRRRRVRRLYGEVQGRTRRLRTAYVQRLQDAVRVPRLPRGEHVEDQVQPCESGAAAQPRSLRVGAPRRVSRVAVSMATALDDAQRSVAPPGRISSLPIAREALLLTGRRASRAGLGERGQVDHV